MGQGYALPTRLLIKYNNYPEELSMMIINDTWQYRKRLLETKILTTSKSTDTLWDYLLD